MGPRRIARQIKIDQRALAPASREPPKQFLDVFLLGRRAAGFVGFADLRHQRSHVRDMRAVGIALKIEMKKIEVALTAGELPEHGLG